MNSEDLRLSREWNILRTLVNVLEYTTHVKEVRVQVRFKPARLSPKGALLSSDAILFRFLSFTIHWCYARHIGIFKMDLYI